MLCLWLSITLFQLSTRSAHFEPYIVQNIRIAASDADAVVVVTVLKLEPGGKYRRDRYRIERTLFGKVPPEVVIISNGIDGTHLTPGSRLLIYIKRVNRRFQKQYLGQWVCVGHFAAIDNHLIEGYPEDRYLDEATFHIRRSIEGRKGKRPMSILAD